jgi:oligogalacturonide lyase
MENNLKYFRIVQDTKPALNSLFYTLILACMFKIFFYARVILIIVYVFINQSSFFAQPVMETSGQKMPNEWIDKTTGHKIIRLTRREDNNMSFYFHNSPFVGGKMGFYGTHYLNTINDDSVKHETGNITEANKQLYSDDLKTLKIMSYEL